MRRNNMVDLAGGPDQVHLSGLPEGEWLALRNLPQVHATLQANYVGSKGI